MYRYKRLLVGLNFTEQDKTVIRYAALISRMGQTEKIYFVHVASALEIPEKIREEYPDMLQPVDEFRKDGLEKIVEETFDGHAGSELIYSVIEGAPLVEMLRLAIQKDIDLVLIGRKSRPESTGKLAEKLARKAPCSVLIIPEGAGSKITKVLVPVDFSENSADAANVAAAFALASGLSDIICLHAYQVPMGYYKTGKSYEQFAEIMKKHAEVNFREFMQEADLKGISALPVFVLDKNPVRAIEDTAKKEKIDLLVTGARGRSAGAAVLLGSVTEQLIWKTETPIIAVKKKGKGMNFLKALLEI
ncbi:MAG: universal stress protein [Syntrophaceae bacterium]|nr:universal stress protein [Syntrophaceae bacterium]